MKHIAFTLLLVGTVGGIAVASAEDSPAADEQEKQSTQESGSSQGDEKAKDSEKQNANLAKDAAERGTPPWTNDSANINLQQPRTPADENAAGGDEDKPYSSDDFVITSEWKKLFADKDHFSTTSGEELYQTLCQACHMEDGQGASGAGDYPSFVGNERLRSPYYAIDVIINGFRGMPPFGDKLSNEQIAGVVNYLRTNFGNQLDGDASAGDVAKLRHEE